MIYKNLVRFLYVFVSNFINIMPIMLHFDLWHNTILLKYRSVTSILYS